MSPLLGRDVTVPEARQQAREPLLGLPLADHQPVRDLARRATSATSCASSASASERPASGPPSRARPTRRRQPRDRGPCRRHRRAEPRPRSRARPRPGPSGDSPLRRPRPRGGRAQAGSANWESTSTPTSGLLRPISRAARMPRRSASAASGCRRRPRPARPARSPPGARSPTRPGPRPRSRTRRAPEPLPPGGAVNRRRPHAGEWRRGRCRLDVAEGRKVVLEAGDDELVELFPREPAQPLRPEVAELEAISSAEGDLRRLREKHLAAVTGRADACRPMDVEPDVVVAPERRLTGVDADPDPKRIEASRSSAASSAGCRRKPREPAGV